MRRSKWLLLLLLWITFLPVVSADDSGPPQGFESLFNGKDLTGWKVNEGGKLSLWGAENGILYVNGGGGGWLMTEKEYSDFELRLEFKIPEKGNSGVALRSPLKGQPQIVGIEIQILDDEWHKINYKGLKPTQLTGSIYGVVPPSKKALKPIGEWNQYHITAKGRHILVELNGVRIVDADLDKYKDKAREHPGMLRAKGHLGLQSHDGRVEFRKLYVKPIAVEPGRSQSS
jgi:hypothetical protein